MTEETELVEITEDRRDTTLNIQRTVLDQILEERTYQRNRWGDDHDLYHTKEDWMIILTSYLGKAASDAHPYRSTDDPAAMRAFKKRLVQTAAICVAALEALEKSHE